MRGFQVRFFRHSPAKRTIAARSDDWGICCRRVLPGWRPGDHSFCRAMPPKTPVESGKSSCLVSLIPPLGELSTFVVQRGRKPAERARSKASKPRSGDSSVCFRELQRMRDGNRRTWCSALAFPKGCYRRFAALGFHCGRFLPARAGSYMLSRLRRWEPQARLLDASRLRIETPRLALGG